MRRYLNQLTVTGELLKEATDMKWQREGRRGLKAGSRVAISKFYVQEKQQIAAGHAGQPGAEEKKQEGTGTFRERQLLAGLQHEIYNFPPNIDKRATTCSRQQFS